MSSILFKICLFFGLFFIFQCRPTFPGKGKNNRGSAYAEATARQVTRMTQMMGSKFELANGRKDRNETQLFRDLGGGRSFPGNEGGRFGNSDSYKLSRAGDFAAGRKQSFSENGVPKETLGTRE